VAILKNEIVKYVKMLYDKGLTSSLGGNVSTRDESVVYISPSKIPKYRIKESQVSVTSLEGQHIDGAQPSSELPTHLAIYRTTDARAVIHVHSHYATLLACLKHGISPVEVECKQLLNYVPLVPYAAPGSAELGVLVSEGLQGHNGVLMKNHGALTVGANLEEAYILAEALERAARLQYDMSLINSL
jgi:L-fuculose-phosphate aldolase